MASFAIDGISLAYELLGEAGPPVLLLAGLGGVGRGWGPQVDRFAAKYRVILPDHRGSGKSSWPAEGYTIARHAADMAGLVRGLGLGPVHVVGSSTGGAIAQAMALDHADTVRSAVLMSSWAKTDEFFRREFELRKRVLRDSGVRAAVEANALFLFAPRFIHDHPERVDAWIEGVAKTPGDPAIMEKRIDMIIAHDELARLGAIRRPVLVLVGERDFCTPPHLSEELARAIPGAELQVIPGGGHFVYLEQEQATFDCVEAFLRRH